jgi:hypothetical protein
MANQCWLIGPLTPHMDRRILPSNGDVLRRLFFLHKLANYRFSEACYEVKAELEHIWQQFPEKGYRFLLFTNKLFPIYFLMWLNIIVNKSRTTKKQQ